MTTREYKALIRYALIGAVVTAALAWTLFLVRDALLVVYISALVAIGLSPLVEGAERRITVRKYRIPRWAAILGIYCSIIGILVGVGLLVIPPLVDQARAFWTALPSLIEQGRQWLVERGVLGSNVSPTDVIRQAPVGGSDAVGTVLAAVWGFIGGIFGFVTILILSFYMLVDGQGIVRAFVRAFPRSDRPVRLALA